MKLHEPGIIKQLQNSAHGSGWLIQILSTESQVPTGPNPTHGRQWVDSSDPF
jgi:hypothetical protein